MDKDLLVSVCCGSWGWHVNAENLVNAARLIEYGLATVRDEYEGPQIFPTDAAISLALAAKLIEKDPEMGGYMRVQRVTQT
jgi:hypothetical protein